MRRFVTAVSLFLFPLLAIISLAGCQPYNNDKGPESVVEHALYVFKQDFPNRDLTNFDVFFAPIDQADPTGLANSQTLAHQFITTVPAGATLQLEDFKITNHEVNQQTHESIVSYQVHATLKDGQQTVFDDTVSQDVSLKYIDGQWLIVDATPPKLPSGADVQTDTEQSSFADWQLYETDWYQISYPADQFTIGATDPALSLVTLNPVDLATPVSGATTYRLTVAASPDSPWVVSKDDPRQLFGHGPILEYPTAEINGRTIQTITLDGQPAYRLDGLASNDLTTDIVAVHNGALYEITIRPIEVGDNPAPYRQAMEDLIATFHFNS